ncbi:MAG: lipopolysaccharide biosynthesis protein [Gammaproteobacteria bacterium GWF2_41_13]|nr:MAG: lipopolysaccharide biosynthesis protein [Gammaproteobacteria bacterium GWF2_41_13]
MQKARCIAFYLPQFHPIPENDEWWGKGFTEWTNVTKAVSLFKGHYQPILPADLGFYDLRVPETRIAQADLAKEYGIEAFCYWHYWFGNGRRILERPFQEVLESGKPDFPFCLAWANDSWSGVWYGDSDRVLIKQTYPGNEDYKNHFYSLLKAFKDRRYVLVNNRLLFLVYNPKELPNGKEYTDLWRKLADKEGLPGFHFVGVSDGGWNPLENGFDAVVQDSPFANLIDYKNQFYRLLKKVGLDFIRKRILKRPRIYRYKNLINFLKNKKLEDIEYPLVIPNWDNTARSGLNGLVLDKSTPELFEEMLENALSSVEHRSRESNLIFVKSWNEWAEGNYVEPDRKFGLGYLEVIKRNIFY